jgi:predicted metal-binding transcription factor (methanogenesis marker protein 9)
LIEFGRSNLYPSFVPCVSSSKIAIISIQAFSEISMTELNLDEAKIKQLLKTALLEVIQEQKEVLSDLLAEIIEDIALEKAIKEGEDTETASREEIFNILANKG